MSRYVMIVVGAGLVLLTGCSTAPPRPDQVGPVPAHRIERPELVASSAAPAADKARIRFTRDDGSLMFGGACGYNLHLDHLPLATLRNGETLAVDVPPGRYAVHFNLTAVLCPAFTSSTVTVNAAPATESRLRLGLRDTQPFIQLER